MKQILKKPRTLTAIIGIILLSAVIIIIGLSNRETDPFAGDAVTHPPFEAITYSIQTFLWWDEGNAGLQAAMVNRVLNFSHVKQTFPWNELEPRQDEWDFTQSDRIVALAEEWEIDLIVRLGEAPEWAIEDAPESEDLVVDSPPANLADWAEYCATIGERYAGRIAAYQIWNEPNLRREWGGQAPNAADYVAMLVACSDAIREVDSEAILISAGLSPTGSSLPIAIPDDQYLDAMYQLNFQESIDVVGVHAPGFARPHIGPDDAVADGSSRWASFRRVEDLRKIMLRYDDAARQMAILEFGYTTDTNNPDYAWFAVSQDEQAQYVAEAYDYAIEHWRPWVGLMSLIYMPNPQWTDANEEWWWAIGTPDGGWRPVFFTLSQMDKYCGDKVVSGWREEWNEDEWHERRDTCS